MKLCFHGTGYMISASTIQYSNTPHASKSISISIHN